MNPVQKLIRDRFGKKFPKRPTLAEQTLARNTRNAAIAKAVARFKQEQQEAGQPVSAPAVVPAPVPVAAVVPAQDSDEEGPKRQRPCTSDVMTPSGLVIVPHGYCVLGPTTHTRANGDTVSHCILCGCVPMTQ